MIAMDILQTKNIITLSGVPCEIDGFSESSDCLSFPSDAEICATKVGADGKMLAVRTGERGGSVTIKVLPNSTLVTRMAAELALIDRGIHTPIQFVHENTKVGDEIICLNGAITKAPRGVTYGKKEVGEMVYVIDFESITFAPIGDKRGSFKATLTGGL